MASIHVGAHYVGHAADLGVPPHVANAPAVTWFSAGAVVTANMLGLLTIRLILFVVMLAVFVLLRTFINRRVSTEAPPLK